MSIVNKMQRKSFNMVKKVARRLINKDRYVKEVLTDLRNHFKKDTYGLSYEIYRRWAKINSDMVFNVLLETAGYRITQHKITREFLIRPKTTKRRS